MMTHKRIKAKHGSKAESEMFLKSKREGLSVGFAWELEPLDHSFGGISSVGDEDEGRENTNTHNRGEVKNEIKKIYDTT